MKFINKKIEPISNKTLSMLEKKYDFKFPKELRDYYITYGDCKIKLCTFEIDGFQTEIDEFYPINNTNTLNFEIILNQWRDDNFIPKTFYPIGVDRGGNDFFWDSNTGEIYQLFHEDIDNHFKICNNIAEFFEILNNSKQK